MQQIKLTRKFNCKIKQTYSSLLLVILRTQLVYQVLILLTTCLINMSFHFHLSHVYTTQFWTSQDVASSNFSLAISCLSIIVYTLKVQEVKGLLVKDLQISVHFLHVLFCFVYSGFIINGLYVLFISFLGLLSMAIGSFAANVIQSTKLRNQIMHIQSEDRKTYKMQKQIASHDSHEHHELTQVQFQDQI